MLDHYCERVADGLWGEPFNALSNLGFLLAAWFAGQAYRRQAGLSGREWDFWVLIGTLVAIGVGSGLWHIYARSWALWADRVPIMLFVNLYLLSGLFRLVRVPVWLGVVIFGGYHVLNQIVARTVEPDFLNASVYYFPSWVFLAGITTALLVRRQAGSHLLVIGLVLFSVSLGFRSADQALCPVLPIGTHFIWHLINALMLFVLLLALFTGTAAHALRGTRRVN